jgi:hypothetical protein
MSLPKRAVPPAAFQPHAGRNLPVPAAPRPLQMRQGPAPFAPLSSPRLPPAALPRAAGAVAVAIPFRTQQGIAALQRKPSVPAALAVLPKHPIPVTRMTPIANPTLPVQAKQVTQAARKLARPLATAPGNPPAPRQPVAPRLAGFGGLGTLPLQFWPGVAVQRKALPHAGLIQRRVGSYKPGTLAYTTKAMRDLNPAQMKIVQQLHDDPVNDYTINQARQLATAGTTTTSNPYDWDVTGIGNYVTNDTGVQSVLTSFGHPTQDVVKLYDTLASRVGHDIGKSGKGQLTSSTVSDLHLLFDASKPLHIEFNPFLNAAWTNNLDNYSGAKTGIPLYSVMRSNLTGDFRAEALGKVTLNDVLKEVSGRPSEVHHVLYKAHYPTIATSTVNLMLTERSESESRSGPGQHELMHMVAAGGDGNKFNVLVPQYVDEYSKWVLQQTGSKLL